MHQKNLNPKQIEAIKHVDGPLLVLAGAGSGKTRVVTERIAHLISLGILPSDILAVTFTNKAAGEMKERVRGLTKENILTCTFHSLGARILRESIENLGYKRSFTIYDEKDSEELLKNCFSSLNIKEEKGIVKEIKAKISQAKNDLLSEKDDFSSLDLSKKHEKIFGEIYLLYQTKLKEYNALDFDDLLYLTIRLFKEHPKIKESYQNRWLFLLIDEYQDTNIAQYFLAKILAEKHKNIFVVGDPDQSIYSWRGAKYQNILNFDKDFPHARVITLNQNYRSTNNILSAANELISHNKKRLDKKLFSDFGEGEKIGVFITDTEKQEAAFVVKSLIDYHLSHHLPLEEIVIFFRTNAQSRIFEDILLSKKIPYVIYGGLSFYQRKEIKDLLSFLRMICSDSDFISFARTINIPKRGIGPGTIEKFLLLAEKTKTPILTLCKAYLETPENFLDINLSKKQRESLLSYLTLIFSLREKSKTIKVHELISDLIVESNYFLHLKEEPESLEDRKENIQELISKAIDYDDLSTNPNLTSFLEELSLLTNIEKAQNNNSIKLMTLHNGKGLEFSLVFIVGMEEDLFPHINTKQNPETLEEERRLCYVGMTRAKKKLFLTAAMYRFMWGTPRIMQPSRFLKEIPAKFLENLSGLEISSHKPIEETASQTTTQDQFQIGSMVMHKTFGIGTIKKIYSSSMGETYDVFFEGSESTKTLVAKYAKLKPF
jgi:DNA helicase II / ATP-dependent DNA helicase PcrA